MKNGGIYWIKNLVNHHIYVGSSVNFSKRWTDHKRDLENNKHCNSYLQNAWNKYRKNNFVFEILEKVENKKELVKREQFYLNSLKPEYNICANAGNTYGTKRTREQLLNISGENNHHSKLTWDKVCEIRKLFEKTDILICELAEEFNLNPSSVSKIIYYRRWKDCYKNFKLNYKLAQKIRKKYQSEDVSIRKLAKLYNIPRSTVFDVIQNKTWKKEVTSEK
jgi:group I intron endonuclease